MSIRHASFSHGWFYHYRVHLSKTKQLCTNNLLPLRDYLFSMFDGCPDDYFVNGPRSSTLRFDLGIQPQAVRGHEISQLAKKGLSQSRYKTAHSNVEVFMLENDSATIAVEIPLWLHDRELEFFRRLFDTDNPLSGHIDVLRVQDDGKIWIWDYKPNAHKEKYASCQTYFYALMLSKRTGIPLYEFRCGHFDDEQAYLFRPTPEHLNAIKRTRIAPTLSSVVQ
ncbi:PD-(D/E)XK nuclease family protein [Candidatus Woesearchaeota archaeon]|nr:PD-(D/E)XK nuclease family protein [Candidatus Woesearchaeota archaeon]